MPGLATLVEAERSRLAGFMGATPFIVTEVDADHCRVETRDLTIHFYRRQGDWPIDSSLELASVPTAAVPLTDHIHTWLVLKARGEDWPPPQSADPLAEELARVSRAVPILRDETALRETLVWDAGYRDGFAEVARPWD